jgi:hypothetical protein
MGITPLPTLRIIICILMLCAKIQFADAWYTPQFNIAMGDGSFNGADVVSSFTIDIIGITCNGACMFGSTARFEGNFTIGDTGVSSNYAYIDANAWGVKMFNDTIDLCSEGNVTSIEGSACPAVGSYSFAFEMALPEKTSFSFLKVPPTRPQPLLNWIVTRL